MDQPYDFPEAFSAISSDAVEEPTDEHSRFYPQSTPKKNITQPLNFTDAAKFESTEHLARRWLSEWYGTNIPSSEVLDLELMLKDF